MTSLWTKNIAKPTSSSGISVRLFAMFGSKPYGDASALSIYGQLLGGTDEGWKALF